MRGFATFACIGLVIGFAGSPSLARAQSGSTQFGHATDALPGLHRVALPLTSPWMVTLSGSGGYGFTESVLDMSDSHHRVFGRLAASLQPIDNLAVGVRFDGRYDSHSLTTSTGAAESDDGLVGDPRLSVRGWFDVGAVALGAQATVWVPGADAPSVELGATTVDLVALAAIAATDTIRLGINAGYRLDQSAASADQADRLSDSDRMSLGVSDFDAVLVGLGASVGLGDAEVYGEWTWDLLVGAGSPGPGGSPMRVGAGGRWFVGDSHALALEAGVEVLLVGRPDLAPSAPLSPVEPRFAVHLAAAYRFPSAPDALIDAEVVPDGSEGFQTDPERAQTGTVRGRLVDSGGQPVPGAEISVEARGGAVIGPVTSSDDGSYVLADVPVGEATLVVRASGFRASTTPIEVREGADVSPAVALERDLPSGQIRGVVQSFRGEPIEATVRVEPVGAEARSDSEGLFEVDVPPGQYEVIISAPGYQEQRRPIEVEERGVTILNADLRRQ